MSDTVTSQLPDDVQLHVQTPLIFSAPLSKVANRPVFLKLENTQPSGSFKLRGIGHSCKLAVKNGASHLVCSSGGNAGMATAYSANRLGVKATVFTMDGLPQPVLKKFSDLGSDIHIGGPIWDICDATAKKYIQKMKDEGKTCHYIHPFDSPVVWDGHSTLIHEVVEQLASAGYEEPGAVVTCVGGGGLLAGIAHGMKHVHWDHVPIVAMETYGADSFNKAVKAGKVVKLDEITSCAKTLGALAVCQEVVDVSQKRKITSHLVDDKTAVECCVLFLRDHQFLVEPACGATLAAVYTGKIREYLEEQSPGTSPIVVVICGGATVDIDTLNGLAAKFDIDTKLEKYYPLEQMRL